MFFKLGFTTIEGGPVARLRFLEDERFVLVTNPDIPATSGEGLEFQEKYYRALYSFLNDLGCLDRYVQHVADEPFDSSKEDYIRLSANIRRWLPNVPLIDAICTSELMEAPDISVLDCRNLKTQITILSIKNTGNCGYIHARCPEAIIATGFWIFLY